MNILVLDDEKEIADLVEVYLKNENYNVFKFYDSKEALKCIENQKLDFAILDVMIKDVDGFKICKMIRDKGLNFPVIMLTAKIEDKDKIQGLTLGADDYITKPFNPLELIARVKSAYRRYTKYNEKSEENIIYINGLEIDQDKHICRLYETQIELTPMEFDILLYLAQKRGNVVSSEELFEKVWKEKYLENNINKETTNTFEFFLEKSMILSDYVVMITPKAVLNTPEFKQTRDLLASKKIDCIQDYGENGFKGVLVETICLFIDTNEKPNKTKVESLTLKKSIVQNQEYITDKAYPYWIIYRDDFFDDISQRLDFNKFTVFRDRQITNSNTTQDKSKDCLRVIKSRNISDDGKEIIDIPGYDAYIKKDTVESLGAYKFVGNQNVYLTPNMT